MLWQNTVSVKGPGRTSRYFSFPLQSVYLIVGSTLWKSLFDMRFSGEVKFFTILLDFESMLCHPICSGCENLRQTTSHWLVLFPTDSKEYLLGPDEKRRAVTETFMQYVTHMRTGWLLLQHTMKLFPRLKTLTNLFHFICTVGP